MASMRPIDATALATTGADRIGRKTTRYSSAPSAAAITSEIATAGTRSSSPPNSIVDGKPGTGMRSSPSRSNPYVYVVYSATAPVAKFTTPELLKVITNASPRAA